ncbi:MAG: RES family NAD+ phosphorylase [Gemmatimonadales bacterium]
MTPGPRLWRCFPWDPAAHPGDAFSPSYVPPGQGAGRFDLQDQPSVLYLAESPVHAVGEALQEFRGGVFKAGYLRRVGRGLALVGVTLDAGLAEMVPDLTEPAVLVRLETRPDALAHHDRRVTQAIARSLHLKGYAGFRWWSAITGGWHATTLFRDRLPPEQLAFETPSLLRPDSEPVREALVLLGIRPVCPPLRLGFRSLRLGRESVRMGLRARVARRHRAAPVRGHRRLHAGAYRNQRRTPGSAGSVR